jgi:hypothetical protein
MALHQIEPCSGPDVWTEENQRGRRYKVLGRLSFRREDGFDKKGTVSDLSLHGCRGATAVAVYQGMVLKLLFLPDHSWPLVVEQAVVRWVEGEVFGLEFFTLRALGGRRGIRLGILHASSCTS